MIEQDFSTKNKAVIKGNCNDIYQLYGCNKLVITERDLATKICSKLAKRCIVFSGLCG
jgi:hypothetical protein